MSHHSAPIETAIHDLRDAGVLGEHQAQRLRSVHGGQLLSVRNELRLLLYAGVLLLVTGLGLFLKDNLSDLGHLTLIAAVLAGAGACLTYCTLRAPPLSADRVDSPSPAYDYVLLLGCLLLGTAFTYLELRYQLLAAYRAEWLLLSGLLYLVAAHRFDNRLVLSLALTTLGAWFGVRVALFQPHWEWADSRLPALAFAALLMGSALLQRRWRWKTHFLPVHLHLAVNLAALAALSGVARSPESLLYLLLLAGIAWASLVYARRTKQFLFLAYGVVYGYLAVSDFLLSGFLRGLIPTTLYLVVTAAAVVVALVRGRRTFGGEA